eukprot:TRINITY_DN9476_c0_g1_i1.p1 TRINITY_DN9476_c0_g1~~TRINITY_DN9476_c0_g1_i1.p1  ORF type:complete len:570 (+),score=84.02 TRINITY_DN9476_c0_g1_i1:111-1820(+)
MSPNRTYGNDIVKRTLRGWSLQFVARRALAIVVITTVVIVALCTVVGKDEVSLFDWRSQLRLRSQSPPPELWPATPRQLETLEDAGANASSAVTRQLRKLDRYNWVRIGKSSPFTPRYAHVAVRNILNTMFVIGGATAQNAYLNDVWESVDNGRSWQMVTPRSDRFSPRRGHVGVVSSNNAVMFILGGFCGKDCFMNDWWNGENGAVWHFLGYAPWSGRHGHAAAVNSKDTLLLMGGHDGSGYRNDVWFIMDPAQARVFSVWRSATPAAAWHPRYGHTIVVDSNDVIVLMGGFFADKHSGKIKCFNDVWKSADDGRSWTLVVEHALWSGRYGHTSEVNARDEIFVIGGLDADLQRSNDVWRSRDTGVTWISVSPAAPWPGRHEHATVMDRHGTILIVGGVSSGAEIFQDVWTSERSCADDVRCPIAQTCRDGTMEQFKGAPEPSCVDNCDRRIFDKCDEKEACRVQGQGQVCVDPCITKICDEGYVCEVAPRGKVWKDKQLDVAEAYCLACDASKTKYACDMLKQCTWSGGDEACQMTCKVNKNQTKCVGLDYCKWDKKKKECMPKEAS